MPPVVVPNSVSRTSMFVPNPQHGRASGGMSGVENTVEGLYAAHFAEAAKVAFLVTGDAHLAEDIAQDAFLASISRMAFLRRPDRFEAYLRRAVLNRCASHHRRRKRQESVLRAAAETTVKSDTDRVDDIDAVRRALGRIPPRQREAMILRYLVDLNDQEIAALMKCRVGTVRSLMSRGRESLRRELP